MRKALKLGLFLCIVAGIAGLAIAYVNDLTQPLIEQQMEAKKLNSFQEVYPEIEEVKDESEQYLNSNTDPLLTEVHVIYQANTPVGVIYMVEPSGYNGKIQLLVGADILDKKITAIKVLSQSETPGLGSQATESFFRSRFQGKSMGKQLEIVTKEPVEENQVLAITSATITSQAVTGGVNVVRQHFLDNFGG
ncbi:MAG TPA: RnfABCDGE type electron transport complex subunit G [Clostridia bacterium]|jgi:electron transport complex protein RnfG|nr:RnfABCDGE type electron transport complex subunit G [Clostridia bacterium]HHY06451.1 RnfABCDGE type electron transport complex subunit G [Clostridia bacterium]